MKNTLKSLVLIWLISLAKPAFATDLFVPTSTIEKMYLERSEESNRFKVSEENSFEEKENDENKKETSSTSTKSSKKSKEKTLPRLKRIYIAAYGGYFHTKNEMQFLASDNCSGAIKPDFLCNGNDLNPIDIDYNDEYFLSAAFGINSQNPIRLELSYFKLGKEIDILGTNKVGINTRNYESSLDLQGGTVNIYFDFAADRRNPYFVFVPYVMAGIGASEIELSNTTFKGSTGTDFSILGKTQRERTVVYGAGFSVGLNNYISLDIGYRYYDFGKIKTGNIMTESLVDNTDPLNPITTTNEYDIELETDLEAHIATIGIKFQI